MTDFQKLELRPLIFLALAKLREPENITTTYFSLKQISEWIYEKRSDLKKDLKKTEEKKKGSSIANILSDIKSNKKTNSNKDGANTFVLRENEKEIGRVTKIIDVLDKHKPYMYSLGNKTVESELSATVVLLLSNQSIRFGRALPAKREKTSVTIIYRKYKDIFELSSEEDVRKIVQDAINGLYFTRSENRLKPTQRIDEERDFLEHLSSPLPELVQMVENTLKTPSLDLVESKLASTKKKSKGN